MRRVLLFLCLFLMTAFSAAAEGFCVKTEGDIIGFNENRLLVSAPEAGHLTVSISSRGLTHRTLEADVPAGDSVLLWDGLGAWEERIMDGTCTMTAHLNGETDTSAVTVGRCKQALLFVFPVRDTIYSDDESPWYAELAMVRSGTVIMEVLQGDTLLISRRREVTDDVPFRFTWTGKNGDRELPDGVYTLRFYAEANPDRHFSFDVTIVNDVSPVLPVTVTGPIMPGRDDPDETVWAMMQAPAMVIGAGSAVSHQRVFAEPDRKSAVLGTLHHVSQCVEVLSLEDGWAKIAAWNHESDAYMVGYVPEGQLKCVLPDEQYGLLVDKQSQTMTIYEYGTPIAVLPVSTGLATEKKPARETTSGSFLTETRIGSFAQDGERYRYVIRYDGGNLLHAIGYRKVGGQPDYSVQLPLLGQKASHGCVRLPCGDTGLPNAYWLYTHLPPNTRVLILQ